MQSSDAIINLMVLRNPHRGDFVNFAPHVNCFRKEGMTVLVNAESYPMEDGRRCKLSRENSSYLGRNGTGGSISQAEMVWAGWEIRPNVRK